MMTDALKTKKNMILETARTLGIQKWTPAEIDQLRRKLIAEYGEEGKTGNDYIADVLKSMGWKVQLTEREEALAKEKRGLSAHLRIAAIRLDSLRTFV